MNFYQTQSAFSRSELLPVIPDWTVSQLAEIAQQHLLHYGWLDAYHTERTAEKLQQINTRSIDRLLKARQEAGFELQSQTLPQQRHLGCCRDFSLFFTALMRAQGVPARSRVGFAGYFREGHWHDHVIGEYWNGDRWVRVDPQLDQLQRDAIQLGFDPLDVPDSPDVFVTAARAWQLYRAGEVDPWNYAIFPGSPIGGPGFIRGNLLHELWSLNKIELLLWEGPEEFWRDLEVLSEEELKATDQLATYLVSGEETLKGLQHWLERYPVDQITCRAPNGHEEVWEREAVTLVPGA
ncbi:hypothetical protein DC3_06750 [Deinococcus cellulosilyticus NBRC 106333 = KACC 11606]|uniref:Transglutaminase-like domain-containing protein n=1 Tax=Deinococcus cellulosilyticus (strain DSM 18568 / NBRC 106333 / KACC 11606 / 5516J-15) TaxID=1223518 RepID=A0A511MWV1_DEIC1|nr:hypothetical protein DC3_06750 [Deinococcus cellulosilyticus NBRC 106333 = KACC 11606]